MVYKNTLKKNKMKGAIVRLNYAKHLDNQGKLCFPVQLN